MAGITGLTTTFNSPNYHGELISVTPTDTPLLSATGGISPTGGQQTDSTSFEWETEDMRDPASRPRLEGADAPDPEARIRANMDNVVQIFQETIATSYTKQATSGMLATTQSAPYQTMDGLGQDTNPVTNEHDHQVTLTLKQIARDLNWTMWHGRKNRPTTNATARRMGGMFEFVENGLNGVNNATWLSPQSAALSAATDTVTEATTPVVNGDKVVFTDVGASTTIRVDRKYFVVGATAGSFKVSATLGGAAITIGTATVKYVQAEVAVTPAIVGTLLGQIFDNGGISEQDSATLWLSSAQRMKLTAAYIGSGVTDLFRDSRTVGGVAMTSILTDFGTLNLATERALPPDTLFVTSTEQIEPVFLMIPGKGVLFEEDLAKTGASEKTQIYGEIGMKAGNPLAHGYLRGLAL